MRKNRTISALGALVAVGAASLAMGDVVNFGDVSVFHGPDDLDLTGSFLYAVNVSPNSAESFTVNGVEFKADTTVAGVSILANQAKDNWNSRPYFGDSADAQNLADVLWDVRFHGSRDVNIDAAVSTGQEYKLQLFFVENYWQDAGSRTFDIVVEGETAVDEFDIMSHSFTENDHTGGVVFTYTFVAGDDNLDIDLLRGTTGVDRIPIISGFTLETVPAPASLAMLGLGGLICTSRRRRG